MQLPFKQTVRVSLVAVYKNPLGLSPPLYCTWVARKNAGGATRRGLAPAVAASSFAGLV